MKAIAWAVLLTALLALCRSTAGELLDFDPDLSRSGWVIVTFPRIPPASFTAIDRSTFEVSTDASAGLLWRSVDAPHRQARIASWRWTVAEGVPPTDLTKRGFDDRAVGVYFVFGTAADATKTPLALLGSPAVTALVYVFGGDSARQIPGSSRSRYPKGHMVRRECRSRQGLCACLRHAATAPPRHRHPEQLRGYGATQSRQAAQPHG